MSEMKVSGGAKQPAPRKKSTAGQNGKAAASSAKKASGTAKPRKKAAPKVAENPVARAAEEQSGRAAEIYDIDDLRTPARRRNASAQLPAGAYDELDFPAKKSSTRRKTETKVEAYDELDLPAKKRSTRRKTETKVEAYDELDFPAKKRSTRKKAEIKVEAYDELDLPAKKRSTRRKTETKVEAYDELDMPAKPRKKAVAKRAPETDPYDLEPERPRKRSRRSGSGGGSRKKRRRDNWTTFLLSAAVCALIALISLQVWQYTRFTNMRRTVEQQTFFAGTIVDGVDVSGMSLQEAQEHWANDVEPDYAGRTVTFDNGKTVTAGELGYSSNYLSALSNAWNAGRTGSLEERYESVTGLQQTPVRYPVTRSFYDEDILTKYVKSAAKAVDKAATEPSIASLDFETFEFSFEEGKPGQALDQEKMASDIRSTLDAGSGSVTLSMNAVQPRHTAADIRDQYGLIASAQTNASSSSSGRLTNIRLALKAINGLRLKPGETFSFNGTVGERTTARGYKPAGAYSDGEVVDEVGGGICQVSTTLFNAVVKADLKIAERYNHSIPVSYVDKGKDATVNWGGQDFKFTNNTDSDVYVIAYLTDNKRVRIGVFGKLLEDGKYITVEAVTTGTHDFTTEYQSDSTLRSGQQKVIQAGRTGYSAEAYKILWSADGKQLNKELLCTSRYPSRNEIVGVGP